MTSVLGSSRHPPTASPTPSPPGGPPPRPGGDSKGALPRCPLPRQVGVGRSSRDTTPRTPRRKRKDQVRTTWGEVSLQELHKAKVHRLKQSEENTAGASRQEVQSCARTHRGVCKPRPLKYWNGEMETAMLPGGLQGRKGGLWSRALGGHPGSASGDSASPAPGTTRSRPTAPSSHLGDPGCGPSHRGAQAGRSLTPDPRHHEHNQTVAVLSLRVLGWVSQAARDHRNGAIAANPDSTNGE